MLIYDRARAREIKGSDINLFFSIRSILALIRVGFTVNLVLAFVVRRPDVFFLYIVGYILAIR